MRIPRTDALNVGDGDFTVAAWIHPTQLRQAAIVALGDEGKPGWYLDLADNRGTVRFETTGPDNQSNGTLSSTPGAIRVNTWQHVAVVIKREPSGERRRNEARIYVNGYVVARGAIGPANLDNPAEDLRLGRIGSAPAFLGDLDEVRLYRRPLDEAEIQGLLQPGKQFVQPPSTQGPRGPRRQQQVVTLTLGDRQFSGTTQQPAFVVVRLAAGPLQIGAQTTGFRDVDRVVLTPLAEGHELAKRFLAFEKRSPRLGVHLGLRRDCGSTFAPVGAPQTVTSEKLTRFVFEGAIATFPAPDVEKDNVNYLAGVREIGVRSEYTDGRDMPRLLIRSVEFEGPYYDAWPPPAHQNIFVDSDRKNDPPAYARKVIRDFRHPRVPPPDHCPRKKRPWWRSISKSSSGGTRLSRQREGRAAGGADLAAVPVPDREQHDAGARAARRLRTGVEAVVLPLERPARCARRCSWPRAARCREQLDAEVERMIDDPRFARFAGEFASQWLTLDKFQVLEPDRKRFPRLTRDTRSQLRQEPVAVRAST